MFVNKSVTRYQQGLISMNNIEHPWLKNRGYLHITPHLDIISDKEKILSKLKNRDFIARYAFFPLIHSVIKERRFKKVENHTKRKHSFIDSDGSPKRNIKSRPLHYASHFDAIIFGYYAELILKKYEEKLDFYSGLSDCVTAYRRIPTNDLLKNKSTIHFANDAFNEIKLRSEQGCEVLKFDIKSFFSRLDHKLLKMAWAGVLNENELPIDHYNVYKAATRFSYILKDDLRIHKRSNGKRPGFDEKRLARIRKKGVFAFYESAQEFRDSIKSGNLTLHKYPFKDKDGKPVGIPQGLPISAV